MHNKTTGDSPACPDLDLKRDTLTQTSKLPSTSSKLSPDERLTHRKEYQKRWHYIQKVVVLAAYSNGRIACACCGETHIDFLTIDHMAGGGNKHRKSIGQNGAQFKKWLIRNEFPAGYQVLCMNCNWAKGKYGKCPHTNKIQKKVNVL